LLWVHQKLATKERLQPFKRSPEFVSGEAIFYLGRSFQLRLVEDPGAAVGFDGTRFLLNRASPDPERAFRRWFIQNGSEVIRRRVEWFQMRSSNRPLAVKVSDLGYRWGSCSARGNLHFNWRLLQLPLRLVDYVVAHEMAHLAVPDHSPRFWKHLEFLQPDCKSRRAELDSEAWNYLRFGT
jgi:predicted metal-dependent hydrolase